jgi:hypothetical protein
MERIWNEAVVPQSKYYPSIFLESLKKTTENLIRTVGVQAEIRTQHLPDTSLQQYNSTSVFGTEEHHGLYTQLYEN